MDFTDISVIIFLHMVEQWNGNVSFKGEMKKELKNQLPLQEVYYPIKLAQNLVNYCNIMLIKSLYNVK